MAIITIFGGDFTGGDALAEDVAKTLDYRSVGREVLAETIRSYGIPEAKLNEVLERDPHWWDRWIENLRPYRIALQAAMCEVATGGNLVYHGHLGHDSRFCCRSSRLARLNSRRRMELANQSARDVLGSVRIRLRSHEAA